MLTRDLALGDQIAQPSNDLAQPGLETLQERLFCFGLGLGYSCFFSFFKGQAEAFETNRRDAQRIEALKCFRHGFVGGNDLIKRGHGGAQMD